MPPKVNVIPGAAYIQTSKGNYTNLGHVSDVEVKDETSIYPDVLRPMDVFSKTWEFIFNLIPSYKREAMWIFFTTGNDLYLRFPKKLRRRRRRWKK